MKKAIATVTLAALAVAAECVGGDGIAGGAPLRAGSRLRVGLSGPSAPIVGTLVQSDSQALQLAVDGQAEARTLRWQDVAVVEVGRTHQWLGFGVGTLVGAGTAAGLVAGFGGAREDAAWAAAAGGLGALPAAAVGAVVGARRPRLLGAAAGAAATALLFVALDVATNDPQNDELPATVALLTGGALGALSGGAAAAVAHEVWGPVRGPTIRVSVMPIPGRGVAGGLAVSF